MFRRLFVEEGYLLIPIVSFTLVAFAFTYFVVRVLRTPRDKIDAAAKMPLRDDEHPAPPRKP